jgi:hypothetical protein
MTDTWQRAKEIAGLLPLKMPWSFCVTNIEDDVVFNVYAPRQAWHPLRVLLSLPPLSFRYEAPPNSGLVSFEEYQLDGLVLSLIIPEEHDDGPDGPDDPDDSAE